MQHMVSAAVDHKSRYFLRMCRVSNFCRKYTIADEPIEKIFHIALVDLRKH